MCDIILFNKVKSLNIKQTVPYEIESLPSSKQFYNEVKLIKSMMLKIYSMPILASSYVFADPKDFEAIKRLTRAMNDDRSYFSFS